MSKSRKAGRKARQPTPADARPRFPGSAAVLLAVVVVAGGLLWWSRSRRADAPAAVRPPAVAGAATSPRPSLPAPAALRKIEGRWVRTDGGYVVEIRSVAPDGKVDAAYFNPRPIHVSKAEASRDGEGVSLFIELRDVNYPGSTYRLRYDPGRDVLEGTYFQALEQQTFVVSFARR